MQNYTNDLPSQKRRGGVEYRQFKCFFSLWNKQIDNASACDQHQKNEKVQYFEESHLNQLYIPDQH